VNCSRKCTLGNRVGKLAGLGAFLLEKLVMASDLKIVHHQRREMRKERQETLQRR
jgi:hypothetical protein